MSETEQRPGGGRLRRLLIRALAVAGTTAAGASLAWALGSGVAVAAEHDAHGDAAARPTARPAAASLLGGGDAEHALRSREPNPLIRTAPERSEHADRESDQDGSPSRSLLDLLPRHGDRRTGPPVEAPADVVGRVTGTVGSLVHRAGAVLEPVGRAGEAVLPGSDGRGALPGVIDDGLGSVDLPVGGPPDSSGSGPELPDRIGGPAESESRPVLRVPEVSAPAPAPSVRQVEPVPFTQQAQALPVAADVALDERSQDDGRGPAPLPTVPPAVPAPVSLPCGTDGYLATSSGSHCGVGLASHLLGDEKLSGTRVCSARTAARTLAGESCPQPGVTPD